MIEIDVKRYLSSKLTVPVYAGEEPKNKPLEYVVLKVIDNGRENGIDAVTFNIVSHSTTLQQASALNNEVKQAMYGITELDNISSSKCGGGGQAINQITKQYAYESVFNLHYMEG
jgi:hypothetical protein